MKINKILAFFLALAIALSTALPAFAAEDGQKKTFTETIYLENAEDLIEFAELCRLDTWSVGKKVILKADIALENAVFSSIPSFAGLFDGNGHTISGFYLTDTITPSGFFGKLQETGILKDLTVSGTVIPAGDARFVGGIVGENYGTITGCTFTGNVAGSGNTGGIAGMNALSGKIMDCQVNGLVIGSDMTGGIVGCNLGNMDSCVNKANVNTVSVDPAIDPADINFDFLTDVSKLTSLDVSSAATDTGGIAGYSSGIIRNCTNRASVGYPHIGYNVGGIVGRSCGYVASCTNAAEITGRKDVGGIAGQVEPFIAKNLTESELARLERQLQELDVLLDTAAEHAEDTSSALTSRLNGIASSVSSAASAAQDIRTTGTITSNVTGTVDGSTDGGVTVTPIEGAVGGGVHVEEGTASGGGIQIGDGSISGGTIHVGEGSISAGVGGSISGSAEGEGNTSIGAGLDAQTQINISTNMAGLSSALYGMAGQMHMLSGELAGASEELLGDAALIKEKINEITTCGFDLLLGSDEDDIIIDGSSEIDIDLITLGKVYDCTNSATVTGDINIGGIAGDMGIEYALDPEDDLNVRIDNSTKRKYEVRAVIQQCMNTGDVQSKRNYTGGIAGKMDLGLIAQCETYGNISSESGNYVGGIAGVCGATVRHCFAKCSLSGGKYIGGIVGSGVEETKTGTSSTVAACYAIVTITEHGEYIGAISGAYAGIFLENYFVSDDLAGINRMSYTGCAQPMSYTELLEHFEKPEEPVSLPVSEDIVEDQEMEESDTPAEDASAVEPVVAVPAMALPGEFKKFNLKFVVDGEVIVSDVFDYGASFSSDVFPDIPQKKGYYAHWDRDTLNDLRFDTTVTAVYEPYISALASADVRDGDKTVFFVQGAFGETDTFAVTSMALTPDAFHLPKGIWDMVRKSLTDGKVNTEIVEQWQLSLPGEGNHSLRYLPPNGDVEHLDVYALVDGSWVELETGVIGSYVTFSTNEKDVSIAIVHSVNTWWAWLIVGALLLIVVILVVHAVSKPAKGKPHSIPEDEENAEALRVPPQISSKKRRWHTPLLVALALLFGILGTSAFFLLPDLMADKGAYEILKDYIGEAHISMELSGEIAIGEESYPLSALVERTVTNDQRITAISENGRTLYYSDGTVFLENGTAYQISSELPDYSRILEFSMELYKHIDVDQTNGIYSITAKGADAKEILELLLPSAAAYLPDTDSLLVELWTGAGAISKITFSGNGKFDDEAHTAYSVRAVLTIMEKMQQEIPAAVVDALVSGSPDDAGALTADLYRLLMGWKHLNEADPLTADVAFDVDCGVLDLNEQLKLCRWNVSDAQIFSVQKNGYGLYFTKDAICDGNGIRISAANAANLDTAKLLDILYTVCMNGTGQCRCDGGQYSYMLTLDEDGMAEVAYAIAPEAKKLNITFSAGSVGFVVENEHIQHIEITISGSVQVVLARADMAISATMDLTEGSSVTLPDIVKSTLVNG